MKLIPLTQGKYAMVDDADYELLSQHSWYCQGRYAATWINGKSMLMHRLILNTPEGLDSDHRDLNGLNNRRYNLRIATRSQNGANRNRCKGSTSKYKGVCWHKARKEWRSQIRINNKQIHIGSFKDEIQAAIAYDRKALELFGEFSCLNF